MAPLKVPEAKVKESRWTKPESHIGMTCAVVGASLAFVGWWQLNEEAKAMDGAVKEAANARLNYQICAATGATLETMGKAMTKVMEKTVASGAIARKCTAMLKGSGVVLGAVAGFAAAYYECKKTDDDGRLHNRGLYWAHLASAGVAFTGAALSMVAILPWFSASTVIPIVGWILAAFGLVTLVAIEGMTDRIGDWLKQCSWGAIRLGDRFLTLEAELSALKEAATP
jgi:hypothetical protein